MVKNKSLIIAGSVLTGVGSALTLTTGLTYYVKYKQMRLTDSEWFKSLVANNVIIIVLASVAVAGASVDAAVNAVASISADAADAAVNAVAVASISAAISAAVNAIANATTADIAADLADDEITATAVANTTYKDLSLADTIDFYKFFIIYASTFIENLDATNPAFADLISTLKSLKADSEKERDTIYALVSLFGAVGPAIVIAGVPTLVTGLVRNNKDKKRK